MIRCEGQQPYCLKPRNKGTQSQREKAFERKRAGEKEGKKHLCAWVCGCLCGTVGDGVCGTFFKKKVERSVVCFGDNL